MVIFITVISVFQVFYCYTCSTPKEDSAKRKEITFNKKVLIKHALTKIIVILPQASEDELWYDID